MCESKDQKECMNADVDNRYNGTENRYQYVIHTEKIRQCWNLFLWQTHNMH